METEKRTILLVEDDPNDVFFIKYAFETAGVLNPIHVAEDGQQAMDFLAGTGQYADRARFPLPSLVLLDLKLPVKMGMEVLRWMHEDPVLQTLLVIILTSSLDPTEVDEAYRLGARSFLIKPMEVTKCLELANAIKLYWLDLNTFPGTVG